MGKTWLVALVALCAVSGAAAAAEAQVVALNAPVWLEREGKRTALRPGAVLRAGDRTLTGAGGRLHLQLPDESTVKLGSEGEFQLPALSEEDGVLKGTLKVLKGAFRFTTSALGKSRRRDLLVSIGPTITAGIRGTDIWGKSDSQQELLCLLEGKIEVSSPGTEPVTMDQALTFFVVPRGQPPNPVAPAPQEKVATWAPQTELAPDEPALLPAGRWAVVLDSKLTEAAAREQAGFYIEKGYPVEVQEATVKGRKWYRLLIVGLANGREATRYGRMMATRLSLDDVWALKLKP